MLNICDYAYHTWILWESIFIRLFQRTTYPPKSWQNLEVEHACSVRVFLSEIRFRPFFPNPIFFSGCRKFVKFQGAPLDIPACERICPVFFVRSKVRNLSNTASEIYIEFAKCPLNISVDSWMSRHFKHVGWMLKINSKGVSIHRKRNEYLSKSVGDICFPGIPLPMLSAFCGFAMFKAESITTNSCHTKPWKSLATIFVVGWFANHDCFK